MKYLFFLLLSLIFTFSASANKLKQTDQMIFPLDCVMEEIFDLKTFETFKESGSKQTFLPGTCVLEFCIVEQTQMGCPEYVMEETDYKVNGFCNIMASDRHLLFEVEINKYNGDYAEIISEVYGTEKEFLLTIPDGIDRDSRMRTSGKCKQ